MIEPASVRNLLTRARARALALAIHGGVPLDLILSPFPSPSPSPEQLCLHLPAPGSDRPPVPPQRTRASPLHPFTRRALLPRHTTSCSTLDPPASQPASRPLCGSSGRPPGVASSASSHSARPTVHIIGPIARASHLTLSGPSQTRDPTTTTPSLRTLHPSSSSAATTHRRPSWPNSCARRYLGRPLR